MDWQAAPFFREEGRRVVPDTRERVTGLTGWRATVVKHGGAPSHLLTPWAWRQAEHLAQHLAMQSTALPVDAILDAIAYWTAEAAGRGVTVRSLALIGQALYADLMSGSGSRIFDRPSNMPQARYDEASEAAAEFAQALSNCNVDVLSLTSTWLIEQLADMLARYGREAIVQGINRTTASWKAAGPAGKPGPEGRTVIGWRFFEKDIQDVIDGRAAPQAAQQERQQPAEQPPPQTPQPDRAAERAAREAEQTAKKQALRAKVFKLRRGWVDALRTKGIEVRPGILDTPSTDILVNGLADRNVAVEEVNEVMGRFINAVLEAKVTVLSSWRKTLVESALAPSVRPADNPEYWAPLRQAAGVLIGGLEAMGVNVDRERLTSNWELRSLAYRMKGHRGPAAIALVVDAFVEHVALTEVTQWRQVHKPFTATIKARKRLAKQQAGVSP